VKFRLQPLPLQVFILGKPAKMIRFSSFFWMTTGMKKTLCNKEQEDLLEAFSALCIMDVKK